MNAMKWLLLLLPFGAVQANDGVYWSSGGVLYPMKESRIVLQREHLSFSVQGDRAQVDVAFEFYNPEATARTLSIGFQAPAPAGDQPDEVCSTPPIEDLRVMSGGRLLPYSVMMAETEDAPLVELGKLTFSQESGGVFVYVFQMTFAPGLNHVQHSYRFRASGSVDMSRSFAYILRTGAKWAGATIGHLTLDIGFQGSERFFVRDIFGPSARWSIVGVGRIGPTRSSFYEEGERPVRLLSGNLRIEVDGLVPEANIDFHAARAATFLDWPSEHTPYDEEVLYALQGRTLDLGPEHPLSKEELRFLRNVIFAQHGYVFKDPTLQATFEQFDWYIPDPNMKWENSMLSPEDVLFVELIKLKEAE